MKRLLRLLIALGICAAGYFVPALLGVNASYFLIPCAFMVLNTLLWDTFKCSFLDMGFFRFIKFIIFVGAGVMGCILLYNQSIPVFDMGLFDLNAHYTDFQICATTGAIGMLAFTFVLNIACVESFGNRYLGPFTPILGIPLGLLYGLLVYFLGAISVGIAKFLALAILALPVIVLFAYIKKYGLLYKDLAMGAAFEGFGNSGGGSRGSRPQKTGNDLQDAMNQIAWNESRLINLHYNNQVKLYVSVSVYSYAVEFEISGTIYSNNPNMTQSQVSEVSDQIDSILSQVQHRILRDAQRKAGNAYDIRVNVGNIS